MLSRLHIENFALFEKLELKFSSGMNVLTGETGAGKSLLVGALELIFGKRLDASLIFHADRRCVIEAEFRILSPALLRTVKSFEEFDAEGETVIIRREIAAGGKSRSFVNDTPVSLQVLREVSSLLVDLHGQHENQSLMNVQQQFQVLDEYAGTGEAAEKFARNLRQVTLLKKQILELNEQQAESQRQSEFFRFQADELEAAELKDGEEKQLEEELDLLENAETWRDLCAEAASELYEQDHSLYNRLSALLTRVERSGLAATLGEAWQENMQSAVESVREAARELSGAMERMDADPQRLNELRERNDMLSRLKIKYAVRTAEELIALRDQYREKAAAPMLLSEQIRMREEEVRLLTDALAEDGLSLRKVRTKAADKLTKAVNALLPEVALEHAAFQIATEPNAEEAGWLTVEGMRILPLANGLDRMQFRVRTNPGLPWAALSHAASGGEISRIMLALKTALAGKAGLGTLIFDEIDTGISGETAMKVGKVMKKTAAEVQIIAITHLPQIASAGEKQFLISKQVEQGTTRSRVEELKGDDRIRQIARMLSGENPSPAAMKNAKELVTLHKGGA